jgi:chitin disaccharide deacetylase
MDTKRLIITSDDFGMCHAINTGIVKAMTQGVVTSSALMVPCPWIAEAVRLAKEMNLPVGIHFTLTCEWDRLRWRPLTAGASLREQHGFMPQTIDEVAATAKDDEIEAELIEQVRVLRLMEIEPTHADVHMLSSDDRRPSALRLMTIIQRVAAAEHLLLPRERDASARHVYVDGHAMISGLSPQAIFEKLEGWTEPGIYHLFGHAGEASTELDNLCTPGNGQTPWASTYRVNDLAFFTDPATRRRIEELGFELIDVRKVFGRK